MDWICVNMYFKRIRLQVSFFDNAEKMPMATVCENILGEDLVVSYLTNVKECPRSFCVNISVCRFLF